MNYLTSIIAAPIFVTLLIFELYLYFTRSVRNQTHQRFALIFIIVSILQTISALFWFGGYMRSTLHGILSEGYGRGEVIDCVGLVGAEILLAIFQAIMSITSCYQMVRILQVDTSLSRIMQSGLGNRQHRNYQYGLYLFSLLIVAYTCLAFTTAYNRRCPQADPKIFPELTHYFYPVYLAVDAFLFIVTIVKLRRLEKMVRESQASVGKAASSGEERAKLSNWSDSSQRARLWGTTNQSIPLSPMGSRHHQDIESTSLTAGTNSYDIEMTMVEQERETTNFGIAAPSPVRFPVTRDEPYPLPRTETGRPTNDHGRYNGLRSSESTTTQYQKKSTGLGSSGEHRYGSAANTHVSGQGGRSNLDALREMISLHRQQLIITLAACTFGVALYIVQFTADVEVLSLVLCCFCVFMYIGYACRRTPFLMYYTGHRVKGIGLRTKEPSYASV